MAKRKVILQRSADIAGQGFVAEGTAITSWFDPAGNAVTIDSGGSGAGGAWTDEDYDSLYLMLAQEDQPAQLTQLEGL